MKFDNDIGKPWRWVEEDGTIVTRGAAWSAPGCHPTGCGIKVCVKDGKLVRIEGDENHPVTKGRLCVRCLTLKDFTYHPDRIVHPMKRAKEDRGKDKWERCTWEEAYDIIATNVAKIKKEYGAETLFGLTGTGRMTQMAGVGAHRALGTPNGCYCQSGFACYGPRVSITQYLLGAPYLEIDFAGGLPGGYDDPRYTVPEMIVQWGKEPLVSNGDGLFGHAVLELVKRGAKLMSIDPRLTWTCALADYHLQIRPGTDAALGMAMLDTIITENLYDIEFVDKWCYGFEQLAYRVHTMPAERVAVICEIPAEEIREAARAYAKAKPAAIAWGLAIDQNINGAQAGQCILSLIAITGNFDVPGGNILQGITDGTGDKVVAGLGWRLLPDNLKEKVIGLEEYPAYVNMMLRAHADRALDALETEVPYKMHGCWVGSTNLLTPTCSAQPKRWYNALKDLDFNWVNECWMSPTAMVVCDVILPIASCIEQDSIVPTHYGGTPNYYSALNKCIEVGEVKGEFENYFDQGRIVNPPAWTGENESTVLEFIEDYFIGGTGVTYEQLREEVTHQRVVGYRKYETGHLRKDGKPGFETMTGRLELYLYAFQSFGEDPLPYYAEPPYGPYASPEEFKKYPLILTTGAREYAYFHSEGRQIPYLRELCPEPVFEVSAEDAAARGVRDGDWVRIENQFGFCMMVAQITNKVKPGLVHTQHGWWFPEEDGDFPHLFGTLKSNINSLVPHSRNGKLGFGAPYKCLICDFRKAIEQDFIDVDREGLEFPGDPKMKYDDNFYRLDQDESYMSRRYPEIKIGEEE